MLLSLLCIAFGPLEVLPCPAPLCISKLEMLEKQYRNELKTKIEGNTFSNLSKMRLRQPLIMWMLKFSPNDSIGGVYMHLVCQKVFKERREIQN